MFKKKSVLFSWTLSYLLMILVLLGTVLVLERQARTKLLEEYKSVIQIMHNRTTLELSNYFSGMERSAYAISHDYTVGSFIYEKKPTGAKYYDLTPIQELLSVQEAQNSGDTRQYLYMRNISKALSSETIFNDEELCAQLRYSETEYDDFLDLLSRQRYHEVILHGTEAGGYDAMVLTSIPLLQKVPKGMIIQVMNNDSLKKIISANRAIENSTSVLMDMNGSVVCGEGDPNTLSLLNSYRETAENDSEIQLGGIPYWIQRVKLDKYGWTLMTVIPMNSITAKTQWVVRTSWTVLMIAVLLMVVNGICFIYIHYQPLKKLRSSVIGAPNDYQQNEYEQLGSAFHTMRTSLEKMQYIQQEQVKKVTSEFLISCMEQELAYDENRLVRLILQLGIETSGEWFGIVVTQGNDIHESAEEERFGLGLVSLLEKAEVRHHMEVLRVGTRIAILLNCETADHVQQLLSMAESYRKEQIQQGRAAECAASRPRRGFKEIHLAYLEACELMQYRTEKEKQANTEAWANTVPRFSAEQERLLVQYITAGNAAEAVELIDLITDNNFNQLNLNIIMARCLAYDIAGGVIRAMSELDDLWRDQAGALERTVYQIRYQKDQKGLAQVLRKAVCGAATACGFALARKEASRQREQPIERIIKCVEDHFTDSGFNVAKAARYLNMNSAYISSLFKSQTGVGLLSYINSLRINYAKKCIVERGLTVNQAAKEAGFENVNTFIRNFKQYEGVTPGTYVPETE